MEYFNYFYKLVIFVAFFVGVIRFKNLSGQLKFVFYYVLFGVLTTVFVDVYQNLGFRNTLAVGHFYIPISFLLLALFYRSVLEHYIDKRIFSVIIFAYLSFSIINPLFIQSLYEFANITGALYSIIIAIFSVLLFTKIMSEAKIKNLWAEPIVLINMGILIYHSGNFFYYVLYNYSLTVSIEFAWITVYFSWIVGSLFYALISVGFLKAKPTKRRVRS